MLIWFVIIYWLVAIGIGLWAAIRVKNTADFAAAGLNKLAAIEGTSGYFSSLGLPMVAVLVWLVIAIEILGGIAILIGYQTRLVAIGLAIFTLLASIAGHAFWAAPADAVFIQQLLFFKNVAVVGGLLVLASAGAGSLSINGRVRQGRSSGRSSVQA